MRLLFNYLSAGADSSKFDPVTWLINSKEPVKIDEGKGLKGKEAVDELLRDYNNMLDFLDEHKDNIKDIQRRMPDRSILQSVYSALSDILGVTINNNNDFQQVMTALQNEPDDVSPTIGKFNAYSPMPNNTQHKTYDERIASKFKTLDQNSKDLNVIIKKATTDADDDTEGASDDVGISLEDPE